MKKIAVYLCAVFAAVAAASFVSADDKLIPDIMAYLTHIRELSGLQSRLADYLGAPAEGRTAQKLKELEEQYLQTAEEVPGGVIMAAPDGRIREANTFLRGITGRSLGELREKKFADLLPAPWRDLERDFETLALAREFVRYEAEIARQDSSLFSATVTEWVVRDSAGKPSGFGALITERKRPDPAYLPLGMKAARTLVLAAAEQIEKRGDQVFPEFREKGGRWYRGDRYVFVWRMDGLRVVYPPDAAGEGKNVKDLKDPEGSPIGKMFLAAASTPEGEGWVHYQWAQPGETAPVGKVAFIRRAKDPAGTDYLVGSGVYAGEIVFPPAGTE
ncbi:MAG: cache domain-containing protein [Candidatus Aureabacteria bacterium]|nr:cache domain-containing protein [Candidatus Auribacterota bacterium]